MPRRDRDKAYQEIELASMADRSTNGNSEVWTGFGDVVTLRAQLDVASVSGTAPALDVVIEDTLDGVNWHPLITFPQRSAVGAVVANYTLPFADRLRARWSLGGASPAFAFAVTVVAQTSMV